MDSQRITVLMLSAAFVCTAYGHHSEVAEYDLEKRFSLVGVIGKIRKHNPHTFISVMSAQYGECQVVLAAPVVLARKRILDLLTPDSCVQIRVASNRSSTPGKCAVMGLAVKLIHCDTGVIL